MQQEDTCIQKYIFSIFSDTVINVWWIHIYTNENFNSYVYICIYVYTQVNEKHDSHNPSDRYGRYQFALDFAPSGFLTHH